MAVTKCRHPSPSSSYHALRAKASVGVEQNVDRCFASNCHLSFCFIMLFLKPRLGGGAYGSGDGSALKQRRECNGKDSSESLIIFNWNTQRNALGDGASFRKKTLLSLKNISNDLLKCRFVRVSNVASLHTLRCVSPDVQGPPKCYVSCRQSLQSSKHPQEHCKRLLQSRLYGPL